MKKVFITLFCLTISVAAVNAQNNQKTVSTSAAPNMANPQAVSTSNQPQQVAPQPQQAAPAVPVVNPNAGKFKFEEETHDFGTVPEGPLAEYDFEFKNVGKEPIVITEAHGSCGCTVPTWPHEPILPKQKAKIHVSYNTNGRQGMINKDVTITSNAQQSPMRLHITGTVTPKPAEKTPAATTPPPPPPGK
jgi:uncharacterized protein DUF1573